MPVLNVGQTGIDYVLRRSSSATRARITVTPGEVEVVVPASSTEAEIEAMLHRRREWLFLQTRNMAERVVATHKINRFVTGAKIPYRGRLMRLRLVPGDDELVEISYSNGFIISYPRLLAEANRDDVIEDALRLWFRRRLRHDVKAFIRKHGEPNGLKARDVRIKDQKLVWGSCGRDRIVNLNWHLVFAPKTVLEYAVVHELCHLRHRNHDNEFWQMVGSILPDWERRKIGWTEMNIY